MRKKNPLNKGKQIGILHCKIRQDLTFYAKNILCDEIHITKVLSIIKINTNITFSSGKK